MPYKSTKQRAYMHIHHPEIAKRWDKKYGSKIVKGKKSYVADAIEKRGK